MEIVSSSTPRPDGSQVVLFGDGSPVVVDLELPAGRVQAGHWAGELAHRGVDETAKCQPKQRRDADRCSVTISGIEYGKYIHEGSGTEFDLSVDAVGELIVAGLSAALKDVDVVIGQLN